VTGEPVVPAPEGTPPPDPVTPPPSSSFDELYARMDAEAASNTRPTFPGGEPAGEPPTGDDYAALLAQARQEMAAEVSKTVAPILDQIHKTRIDQVVGQLQADFIKMASPTQAKLSHLLITDNGIEAFKLSVKKLVATAEVMEGDLTEAARIAKEDAIKEIDNIRGTPFSPSQIVTTRKLEEHAEKDLAEGHGLSYLSRELDGFAGHRDSDRYRDR
jgi:hypothetical protein